MTVEIIQERLSRAKPTSAEAEKHVLREILQELALSGLSQVGFFKQGAFHGGSCLRIAHGLRRFSEDLDFVLREPNPTFSWTHFAEGLRAEFSRYEVELEIQDRSSAHAVKALFLKDQSLGKILRLRNPLRPGQKLLVKLEIDVDPPTGATFETRYVDFPVPFSILAQDLPSSFASKMHALLCRTYVKGRDWFDFLWYVQRKVVPKLGLLANALAQQGPWQGATLQIDVAWVAQELARKVDSIDWAAAQKDVERFLAEPERRGLAVWQKAYFGHQVEVLAEYLNV